MASLSGNRSLLARTFSRYFERSEHKGSSDGSPDGSRADNASKKILSRFFSLFFTHFTQGIQITLPFIISAYLVRDLLREERGEEAADEQTVGRLAGLLGASYCGSQLLTSYFIGRLSDRIGRKPIMVLGNISCIVSATAFGLAGSYWTAVLARVVGGLFNGIIGAEKAILGETLSIEEQGKAFSYFSIAWGVGALSGPLLGGALARPCSGFLAGAAACAPGSLLQRRPYVLPCLVAAGFSLVATLLTLLLLEETLPALQKKHSMAGKGYAAVPAGEEGREEARGERGPLLEKGRARGEIELGQLAKQQQRRHGAFRGDSARSTADGSNGGKGAAGSDSGSPWLGAVLAGQHAEHGHAHAGLEEGLSEDIEGGGEGQGLLGQVGGQAGGKKASSPAGGKVWWKQKSVLLALLGYGLIAFFYNMTDEVVPIFASAPTHEGGLEFDTSELAPSVSFGGVVLMLWALLGFPVMVRTLGMKPTCCTGLWGTPLFCMLFPVASLFVGRALPVQLFMFAAYGLRGIASTNAFTACIVMVNAAAPPGTLGAVNGVGQSIASFVRAAAPALGGLSWGWSNALGFAGHQFLPFVAISIVALLTLFVYEALELPEVEVVATDSTPDGGAVEEEAA